MAFATKLLEKSIQIMDIMTANLSGGVSLTIQSTKLRLLLRHNTFVGVLRNILSRLVDIDNSHSARFGKKGYIRPAAESICSLRSDSRSKIVTNQGQSATRFVLIVRNDVTRRGLKPVMISGLSSHIVKFIKNRMIGSVEVDFVVTSHIK